MGVLYGGTTTLGEEMTVILNPYHWGNGTAYEETQLIDKRNNYRMPSSHRLNIGVNFRKKKKHGERIWNISIYNIYNAMNPTFVYRDYKEIMINGEYPTNDVPVLKKVTIIPIIPSFSYTYKF